MLSFSKFHNRHITDIITDITATITDILFVEGDKNFSLYGRQHAAADLLKHRDLKFLFLKSITYFLITTSPTLDETSQIEHFGNKAVARM